MLKVKLIVIQDAAYGVKNGRARERSVFDIRIFNYLFSSALAGLQKSYHKSYWTKLNYIEKKEETT